MSTQITTFILIAATIPFVASILSALSPKTRVNDIGDYFLYDNKLDVDSFVKTTVGYSLQVASIFLFFYWTLTYGIAAPVIVCISWGLGYVLISFLLQKGKLDNLLKIGADDDSHVKTIHGIIGNNVETKSLSFKNIIVFFAATASIIGIGGTMMTEVDYSTAYIVNAIGSANNITIGILTSSLISLAILLFTAFYVLWGGYRSVVFTDRFQTPVAYGAFALFSLILAIYGFGRSDPSNTAIILSVIIATYSLIGWRRLILIKRFPNDPQLTSNRFSTFLTFSPIVFFGFILLVTNLSKFNFTSLDKLGESLFVPASNFLGFGIWGIVALVFVNALWQLVDISSLQRLQSLEITENNNQRFEIGKALTNTGIEAGLGWIIICFVAVLLKEVGLSSDFVKDMIMADNKLLVFGVIVFIFTCVVYMLSTISGFISALSYISYYDLVPIISGAYVTGEGEDRKKLALARMTTIAALAIVAALYIALKTMVDGTQIAYVLYAIYAFQIVILPSAFLASTGWSKSLTPYAVFVSIIVGAAVACWTATSTSGWRVFEGLGVNADSWAVMPPFLSGFASIIAYITINYVERLVATPKAHKELKD